MPSQQFQTAVDEALGSLSTDQGVVGSLVLAFLYRPRPEDKEWLDKWFGSRIEQYFTGPNSNVEPFTGIEFVATEAEERPLAQPIKLKSLRVHHFRGFRGGMGEIDLEGKLIVVEGKNSSGKTSLAEALEWLLSGSLSRRENGSSGNVRELANLIANRHRPPEEHTWVSATFSSLPANGHSESFVLRRELHEDYGTSANAISTSILYLNDKALDSEQEKAVLDRYFAGVSPLLMQHTMRDFVHSDPKWRRSYFERLLRIDEVTELIRSAVITDKRLAEFPSPNSGEFLNLWNQMRSLLRYDSSKRAIASRNDDGKDFSEEGILDTLLSISRSEFPSLLSGLSVRENITAALLKEQEEVRLDSFPLLSQVQPPKRLSTYPREGASTQLIDTLSEDILSAWEDYEPKLMATHALRDRNHAVAKAFEILLEAGAVQKGRESQTCPLCAFELEETLSAKRISTISEWNSVSESMQSSRLLVIQARDILLDTVKRAIQNCEDLFPFSHDKPDWDNALEAVSDNLREEAQKLRESFEKHQAEFMPFVLRGRKLLESRDQVPESLEQCESLITDACEIVLGLASVPTKASEYAECYASLETTVGMEASKNVEYRINERMVSCFDNASLIAEDLLWEKAKRRAQKELAEIRDALITYRQDFLNNRSTRFSEGIGSVWNILRDEQYSGFSQLQIPRARGLGFQVAIELKAFLDDGFERKEADALSVFSESHVNALGIAAYLTRSQLLGHRVLVLDDPVQSMDEDHFYTFARDLIPSILSEGYQLILFTHNDFFARAVSYYNSDSPGFVTLKTVHSPQRGSVVEEGNRTITERLRTAIRMLELGNFDYSWTCIRLAIERICTLSYMKHGTSRFSHKSWQNLTAADMLNRGAGEVIVAKRPDCENELREIIRMTAPGSHDSSPLGETEIRKSVRFLKKLSYDLKIGN